MAVPCADCPTGLVACDSGHIDAPVFGFLDPTGALVWYDASGTQVPTSDVLQCGPPVCCRFPTSHYTDVGNGGLHCFDDPAAGVCNIPAGTWQVTAGGDTSPYAGTMLVRFSDGQKLFEQPGNFNCGDFGEVAPPISNSGVFTFAGPVTATLFFEQDNGEGVSHPITNPFICYQSQ